MLPCELRLASLGHCYIHLPETFVFREKAIKGGAIVSVKSIQTDNELFVMWNGQLTSGEYVQLDLDFGLANNLKDELVIINSIDNLELSECSSCHVELLDSNDYNILAQHTESNLLDTCRLINRDLVVPIYVSQNVKVLVRVQNFVPDQQFGLLTKWTELLFHHNLTNVPQIEKSKQQKKSIEKPIHFISCALGIEYKPKFHLGSLLIHGDKGCGKTYLLKNIIKNYNQFHSEYFNCKQLRGKRPEGVKKKFDELLLEACEKSPFIIALDDIDSLLISELHDGEERGQEALYKRRLIDTFCRFLKQIENQGNNGRRVVLLATCRAFEELDERVSKSEGRQYFTELIKVGAPNMQSRIEVLQNVIGENRQIKCALNASELEKIAERCNSYMPSDLQRLFERALINACSRASLEFNSEPLAVQFSDFIESIEGYVPINLRSVSLQPKTARTFENVGGMRKIREILMKTILLPIKYPKLYAKCPLKQQNSILLYGPPGCGKTLIAEALTNEANINSICIRGPELLSKYIGASEAAVRDLFKRAQMASPCVIFFDEFESLVAKRGSDSTGVTDRVVNQFLTILDGVEKLGQNLFIVAATSRPDMIDPAMLRPGRLDRHVYCPMPEESDRLDILNVLSRDMTISKDLNFASWSSKLEGFTGADIQALLCSAQLKALHEVIGPTTNPSEEDDLSGKSAQVDAASRQLCVDKDFEIVVGQSQFADAFSELKPDVEAKLNGLLQKYKVSFNQTNENVAKRVTLA